MKQIYPGPIDRLVWMQQEAGGAIITMLLCLYAVHPTRDKTGAIICHKIIIVVSTAREEI